jgi:phosphoribosylamine---glycine ligase
MRVLLLGSGGREHALARALASDGDVTRLHVAPGNPGIGELAELHQVTPADPVAVTELAARTGADLVVVGPEAPLLSGVADAVRAAGRRCFGPSRAAAMIEGSKSFAKEIMLAAGVPTAASLTCQTPSQVRAALDRFGPPYVVKADGLAAGKGVVVTTDPTAAAEHASECGVVVIEEYLAGPEVSVFALADGVSAVPLLPAQDYKRAGNGDTGPNTGGMGAYAPIPWAPPDLADRVITEVVMPALAALRAAGTPYQGLLYAGLALTSTGIKVIEFNARFGDPETQVIIDRLATPLAGLLNAAAVGDLAKAGELQWTPGAAVTVVIAAENYPGPPVTGDTIENLFKAQQISGAYILHAGTTRQDGTVVTSGGRVLNVVGTGPDLTQARAAAYTAAALVKVRGGWYRTDIADLSQDHARPIASPDAGE